MSATARGAAGVLASATWRRALARGGVLVVLLGVLLGAGWFGLRVLRPVWQAVGHLEAARVAARPLVPTTDGGWRGLPSSGALGTLESELAAAHVSWTEAADGLGVLAPLLERARGLPSVGPLLGAAPDLATLAAALSGTGADLSGASRLVVAELEGGPLSERLGPALARLRAERPRLERAERSLAVAEQALERVGDLPFPGPLARLESYRDLLMRWLPPSHAAVRLAVLLPEPLADALGLDAPRTYLVLGQTEEERRASGGYVGSIGLVRVAGARIVAVDFRDSRDWSNPAAEPVAPPTALADFMGFGAWYVRDANWFAEFPTSAAWAEWFLARDWGLRVDGAVAFDQETVRSLLRVLGPIELPSYRERITADNLRERATYWLYAALSGGDRREFAPGVKSPFVVELGQALLQRLVALEPREAAALVPVAQRLLAEKHVLVALKQPVLASLLREQGWDGRLPRSPGDFLYVLEHTASYSKVAPYVLATRHYTVTVDARGVPGEARLVLRYENRYDAATARALYPPYYLGTYWDPERRREAFAEGYYAALLRIYVPRGSTLLAAEGWSAQLEPDEEAGHTVLGGLLWLPAGATRAVTLTYRPGPTGLPAGTYRLLLPKQPGTVADAYTVTVRPPAGVSVASTSPAAVVRDGAAHWQGALRTDQQLLLTLAAG